MASSVATSLSAVRERIIAAAASSACRPPRLVGVSKLKPVPTLMEAYEAGLRHFGENYVKEIAEKAPEMPTDVKWHFIGALQSNKVKVLIQNVPNLYMVESVGSIKLAKMLQKHVSAAERKERLKVLVQVNTSAEESKSGVKPEECTELVKFIVENCNALQFSGLMTIGKLGDVSSTYFDILAQCRDDVIGQLGSTEDFQRHIDRVEAGSDDDGDDHRGFELSMGMSADFELAINSGSTNVRIGSTIFGARPPKNAN